MAFRKISADQIFDGYKLLTDQVLITTDAGVIEAVVPAPEAGDGVEKFEGLLTPGFVNCHCHLELSHMRGKIPEHTGLVDFVLKVVTERFSSEEEIADSIAAAEQEMKAAGIVAVGDICNNSTTLLQKQKGNLQYYNFIEASGWLPEAAGMRFEQALQIYHQFAPGFPSTSIVPHAPYSVSEKLWEKLQSRFAGKTISIHNQETAFEDEFFMQGTGDFQRMYQLMKLDNSHHVPCQKSSLQSYLEKLQEAQRVILVHNTFTREEDMEFVKQVSGQWLMEKDTKTDVRQQLFFCLCVNANQYIENALPPIQLLRKHDCSIVLGTDSLASNRSLSLLDEMKTIRNNFPAITLEEMLRWATSNGARALGFDTQLGSFEKGKRPGVVLIDKEKLAVVKTLL